MYQLNEQQIDYIYNDIRARGVEMESLQNDLVDHVCCIVEQQLEATGDFERFYDSIIKTFYKKELREIEEETKTLLKNKNYYAMKKAMITSGIISASLLTLGIILKFMHMPGASFGIVTGITSFSFIFLPLMFLLKIKEKQQSKDKLLIGLGSVVAILISLATMFKIMHWPYANMMGIISVGILFLLYLPINLVTGIRNPETKVNTIISSILLVAGCGLFLSLARSPHGSKVQYINDTAYYLRNEQLYQNEQQKLNEDSRLMNTSVSIQEHSKKIIALCDELKSYIIEKETGKKELSDDFIKAETWLGETYVNIYFPDDSEAFKKYSELISLLKSSRFAQDSDKSIIGAAAFLNNNNERVVGALNNLVQVQLFALQIERESLKLKL